MTKTTANNKRTKTQSVLKSLFFCTLSYLCFSVLTICCTDNKSNKSIGDIVNIQYANGFSIEYNNEYKRVTVYNPWDTTKILQQYILVKRDQPHPTNLPEGKVVEIPVQSIACFYSIDASMLELLGELEKVKAIAEARYVKIPSLKNGLYNGTITNIGESTTLNIEALLNVAPDIIIVSPFQNQGYGKLETTGITIIENAGYMEQSPLGRAEWIRFIAAFVEKDKEAELLIEKIADRYHFLQELTKKITYRPTVFSEMKYGATWYIPGGNSYMAQLYHDAGTDYIWKDDAHTGSLALNFESVYHMAENADYWVIKADKNLTYDNLKNDFEAYSWFKAWQEKKIIYCNTAENNYYEEGTMNPDLILEDLIRCFHPGMLSGNADYRYFKPLNE